jgi:hypothetical protein
MHMQGGAVARRSPGSGSKPARKKKESKPAAPAERHSGEGSASALEVLQKLEDRHRLPKPPADSRNGEGNEPDT